MKAVDEPIRRDAAVLPRRDLARDHGHEVELLVVPQEAPKQLSNDACLIAEGNGRIEVVRFDYAQSQLAA
jgi:hypothetical protein